MAGRAPDGAMMVNPFPWTVSVHRVALTEPYRILDATGQEVCRSENLTVLYFIVQAMNAAHQQKGT